MTFGDALKAELQRQGRSIGWLSEQTGISHNTISAIIRRGSNDVKPYNIESINKALGVNLLTQEPITNNECIEITFTIKGGLIEALTRYFSERSK